VAENGSTASLPADDDHFAETESVVQQVSRFMRLMKRSSMRFAAQNGNGLELAAYFLLAVLVTEGPQRTTALADAVLSDISTVSRQISALVKAGLVERQADPADGRACLLAATPQGKECFEQQRTARTRGLAEILRDWTSEDLRTVGALLERFNSDFERYDQHSTGATSAVHTRGGTR
jgi:DNA-binding MarR family transcriptional regulator